MTENFPALSGHALGVDGNDDALAAEALGTAGDQFRRGECARVDADLSAPACNIACMSLVVRIPPPTVSGMKHCAASAR
jgi:hypothetical protein